MRLPSISSREKSDTEDGEKAGQRRLEYSPSSRAKCIGTLCKGTDIAKGELRLGTLKNYADGKLWYKWRHWGCATPMVIKHLKKSVEIADEIDGFHELLPEDQEKVQKAWAEGKIADEDVFKPAKKPTEEEKEEKGKDKVKKKARKPKE
ncbi:zf-PARP-domain-containing protein [Laetiporus sulphureus 93-53]|uniref:Zf-PARP-domain-containing protein n=1 Tax=Laetiporus sulphureus 93-53 TaxID=1314785 RepID=A0A165EYP3_9APHY|nr:zf-PARP-domain-containing protein [Laetiporus sulphureus 93-53]KZT07996.1 zf-PARP-domain-containing protein [Laetiporus sulphureus 93-53]